MGRGGALLPRSADVLGRSRARTCCAQVLAFRTRRSAASGSEVPGARFARFVTWRERGRDAERWAGHFGTCLGPASLLLLAPRAPGSAPGGLAAFRAPRWPPLRLPLRHAFNQGGGAAVYRDGALLRAAPWLHLSQQDPPCLLLPAQPTAWLQEQNLAGCAPGLQPAAGAFLAELTTDVAFNGGSAVAVCARRLAAASAPAPGGAHAARLPLLRFAAEEEGEEGKRADGGVVCAFAVLREGPLDLALTLADGAGRITLLAPALEAAEAAATAAADDCWSVLRPCHSFAVPGTGWLWRSYWLGPPCARWTEVGLLAWGRAVPSDRGTRGPGSVPCVCLQRGACAAFLGEVRMFGVMGEGDVARLCALPAQPCALGAGGVRVRAIVAFMPFFCTIHALV